MTQEHILRARDDFDDDDLRAERDLPSRYRHEPNRFAGLWKQIALGIVVGYSVLGILSVIAWAVIGHLVLGGFTLDLP